jgi:hypothetical protein
MSPADATPAIGQAADYCAGLGLTVNVTQGGRMLEVIWPNKPAGADPPGVILLHAGDATKPWVYADSASGLAPF